MDRIFTKKLVAAVLTLLVIVYFGLHITAKNQELRFASELLDRTWQWGLTLSQDESSYLSQAKTALEKQGPAWADQEAFYRPPLASLYFQYLYITTNFNRLGTSIIQSAVAFAAYLLLFIRVRDYLGFPIALAALVLSTVHPVLIFYNTSGEDSVLALFFISWLLFLLLDKQISFDRAKALFLGIIFGFAIISRANMVLVCGLLVGILITFLPKFSGVVNLSSSLINQVSYIKRTISGLALAALANRLPHLTNSQWHPDNFLAFGSTKNFGIEITFIGFLLLISGAVFLFLFDSSKPLRKSTANYSITCFSVASFLNLWFLLPAFFIFLLKVNHIEEVSESRTGLPTAIPKLTVSAYSIYIFLFILPSIVMVYLCAQHNYREIEYFSIGTSTIGENLNWGNSNQPDYQITMQGFGPEWWVNYASPFREFGLHFKEGYPDKTPDHAKKLAAIDFIKNHPSDAFNGVMKKWHRTIANYEIPRNRNFFIMRVSSTILSLPYPPFSIITILALISLLNPIIHRHPLFVILMLITPLSLMLIEVAFFNASRYRALGLPFLLPFATVGIIEVVQTMHKRALQKLVFYSIAIAGFYLLGANAVDQATQDKYHSVDLYKLARLQLITDGEQHPPGLFVIDQTTLFQQRLEKALKLFPKNIEAFYLQQIYRIYALKQRDLALQEIIAYQGECRVQDFVCHRTMKNLVEIAGDPEAFIRKLGWDSSNNERYFIEYRTRQSKKSLL